MSKVLIVDDSPTQLFQLRQILEQAGHSTLTADCGEQAIELANCEHPEVILMDIVMPGMSGYQVKRQLGKTKSTRHIPVIFVSRKDGDADRAWGLRQGAREYVTKPVNPSVLLTAISEAMAA
ncbi:MAG: response regulator [Anderseniella sp.]|jgi:twitching motility two-component system response regulator PilH